MQGRDVVLICNKDVGAALSNDTDNDAVHLARAGKISEETHVENESQTYILVYILGCLEDLLPSQGNSPSPRI